MTTPWTAALGELEQFIDQSLARTPEPPPPTDAGASLPDPLAGFNERQARWQACLDQADASGKQADDLLAACVGILEGWLNHAGPMAKRLNRWVRADDSVTPAKPETQGHD